jgi:hypothetical protein
MKKKKENLILVAQYIGPPGEIYIPSINQKLVKAGDNVPEFSVEEAEARRDFTIVYEKENK